MDPTSYIFACMWEYVQVCVNARGGLRLLLGLNFSCSSTLFSEAGALNQMQNSLILSSSLARMLWHAVSAL